MLQPARRYIQFFLSLLLILSFSVSVSSAQEVIDFNPPSVDCDCADSPDSTEEAPALPPEFGGPILTRARLTGDWFGVRTKLAEHGLDFKVFGTQFSQGIVKGGTMQDWEYGSKFDYLLDVDGQKLGLWQGFFVNIHAETRLGDSVNRIDGALSPANLSLAFPKDDEDISSVTALKFTQALSENFAVYFGKLNTLDEYPLRFSPELGLERPGVGGFMNAALVFNLIAARTIPYSTFGIGGAILREGKPIFSVSFFDPEERATIGLQDLYARGVVVAPDLLLRTKFFGRPGLVNIGGTYSNADYRSVDPSRYLIVPDLGVMAGTESSSWSIYTNYYQAIWVDPCDNKRTWGVFGQVGVSDGDPNPIEYFVNIGIAGRSMLPRRKLDTFGIGYYYIGLSDDFKALAAPRLPQRDGYGGEIFYNIAITPWCRFTLDLQLLKPSTRAVGTTVIPGFRVSIDF